MTRLVADLKAEVERLKSELELRSFDSGDGPSRRFNASSAMASAPSRRIATVNDAAQVMQMFEQIKRQKAIEDMQKLKERRRTYVSHPTAASSPFFSQKFCVVSSCLPSTFLALCSPSIIFAYFSYSSLSSPAWELFYFYFFFDFIFFHF